MCSFIWGECVSRPYWLPPVALRPGSGIGLVREQSEHPFHEYHDGDHLPGRTTAHPHGVRTVSGHRKGDQLAAGGLVLGA
ncbi:hypothetical protein ACIQM4_28715 [Streptomyces sp. NPDC091272]|uniref:hypothetical protein n=1 Tax=Streptomyces sp. NPDC091272 TaxID=3365981 RepID=UPI0037F58EDC